MPVAFGPLIGAGLGALQQGKIERALSGDKEYTKPKTIFGKLIGGVSGRTAAAEASASVKTSPLSNAVMNSLQPKSSNLDPSIRQSFPVAGGLSFGGEATKKTYLPFYIVGAIVAIFFFMRKKGGRRRR
ncbi:MAG: hypothetical protein RL273_1408 [Bacteroidota bacterium]